MTKNGYIRELEECLRGEIPGSQLAETLDYYRSYIEEAVAAGQDEEAVTEELGSPRLIARSVIDAYGGDDHIQIHDEYVQEDSGEEGSGEYEPFVRHRRYENSNPLTQKIAGIAILVGIFIVLGVLLRLLLPVLVIGVLIWFIMGLFSGR